MFKERLFTPGPTPVPSDVLLKMAEPIIYHRTNDFENLYAEMKLLCQQLFITRNDAYAISGSGTVGMEMIVANFTHKSDVLCINCGKFGERWVQINQVYNNRIVEIKKDWGKTVSADEILVVLNANKQIRHLFLTQSETSSGTAFNIEEIARRVRNEIHDIFIAVDGITSIVAMPFYMDEWGIDAVVTGSQKGLMMPPGLALFSISEQAERYYHAQSFFLDYKKLQKEHRKNQTPFTPPIQLIKGLHYALGLLLKEGLPAQWQRHNKMANAVQSAIQALGFELLSELPSQAVTAVLSPQRNSSEIVKLMKRNCAMTISDGQDHFKGKLFRLAHLGYYDYFDVISMISGLEYVLYQLGDIQEYGAGLKAAQECLFL